MAASSQRTLIRGATIITMDAQGDLPRADLLVTGDTAGEALRANAAKATYGHAGIGSASHLCGLMFLN